LATLHICFLFSGFSFEKYSAKLEKAFKKLIGKETEKSKI